MERIHLERKTIVGHSIRTKNVDEMNPATGKIGHLWQKFFSEIFPRLKDKSEVFGVYTNYQSDHLGEFDVVAGSVPGNGAPDSGLTQIELPSGDYVMFAASGELPKIVIELWPQIWAYFADKNCPHQRAYTADFELYKGGSDVEIYIAVK
jgi:predicted transcriptional regulator YdeE